MKQLLLPLLTVILLLGCLEKSHQAPSMPQLYTEGEEALKAGCLDSARLCIDEGMRQAADSDEYYRFVVLQAKYYFCTMHTDSFVQVYRQLGQYLQRLPRKGRTLSQQLLQTEHYMQRGVLETKMTGRMDSAQHYNMLALNAVRQLPFYTDNELVTLTNVADVYKQQGRYDKSVSYFREAMELGDSVGMSNATRCTIAIGIASAYAAMGSFEQSNTWWQKAEQLRPFMQHSELFHYLNNRGNDYYLQGRYEESLQCFMELDTLIGNDPNMLWERMFMSCNMSDLYIKLGHTAQALPLLEQAEAFFTSQQQAIPLYYLATQRIELALLSGRPQEALRLASVSETPSWMIPEQLLLRQKVLLKVYERTGQWLQYAEAMHQLDHLQDSIASDNMKMCFSEALMRYEHEKQMLEKQRQLEQQERSFRGAVLLLVVLVIIIVLLTIIFVQKQRQRKLEQMEMRSSIAGLRMQAVRNRITPHFISNALTAEMVAQMDGKEIDLDPLVRLLHRGIEFTGTEQTTLADELQFISFYCSIESRSIGPDFCYEEVIAPDVDTQRVVLPSMSVQILVENAIKHGLKAKPAEPGKQRRVTVKATRKDQGTLVEVTDNGVGVPDDRQRNEHTGLRVVRQTLLLLNEQNRQKMDFSLENYRDDGVSGCRASLYLPDDFEYTLKNMQHGK